MGISLKNLDLPLICFQKAYIRPKQMKNMFFYKKHPLEYKLMTGYYFNS